MSEEYYIEDLEEFINWFQGLSQESVDLHEAMTIYFNQEIYMEVL